MLILRALSISVLAASLAAAVGNDAADDANDASDIGSRSLAQRRMAVDCTEYQHTFEMPFSGGAVVMDYVVAGDTFRARLTRQGVGWVALAVPEDSNCMLCMKNSDAVIGVPGGSVLKYDLEAYRLDGVVPMQESRQTLEETSVMEIDGTTVVTFVKKLVEVGENGINGNGPNTFLWAMGPEGLREELAYHTLKGKFQLDLTPCDASATDISSESESPTAAMPVQAPPAPSASDQTPSGSNTDSPTTSIEDSDADMTGDLVGDESVTSDGAGSRNNIKTGASSAAMLLLLLTFLIQS